MSRIVLLLVLVVTLLPGNVHAGDSPEENLPFGSCANEFRLDFNRFDNALYLRQLYRAVLAAEVEINSHDIHCHVNSGNKGGWLYYYGGSMHLEANQNAYPVFTSGTHDYWVYITFVQDPEPDLTSSYQETGACGFDYSNDPVAYTMIKDETRLYLADYEQYTGQFSWVGRLGFKSVCILSTNPNVNYVLYAPSGRIDVLTKDGEVYSLGTHSSSTIGISGIIRVSIIDLDKFILPELHGGKRLRSVG